MTDQDKAKILLLGYSCTDCINILKCIMGDWGDEYTGEELCNKWEHHDIKDYGRKG